MSGDGESNVAALQDTEAGCSGGRWCRKDAKAKERKMVPLTMEEPAMVDGAFTEKTFITPQMAAKWLESNENNRRVQQDRVKLYASVMARGGWHFTHQGIAFYDDGRLADGQHRLLAIALSQMSVWMNVTYGLKLPAATAVDTGRPRNLTNAMHFMGMDTRNKFVPVARALFHEYLRQRGDVSARNRAIDNDVFIAFAEAARPAVEFSVASSSAKGLSHAVVRAAISAAWFTSDRERLSQFKDQLQSGVISSNADSAVARLRDWLQTTKTTNGNARPEIWSRSCTALLAYLEYRPLSKLYARDEATFTIPDLI